MKPWFIKVNELDHKSCPGSGDWCVCMTQHNRVYGYLFPVSAQPHELSIPAEQNHLTSLFQVCPTGSCVMSIKLWLKILYFYEECLKCGQGAHLCCFINMLQPLCERIHSRMKSWCSGISSPWLFCWNYQPRPIWYQLFASRDTCPPGPLLKIPFHTGNHMNLN